MTFLQVVLAVMVAQLLWLGLSRFATSVINLKKSKDFERDAKQRLKETEDLIAGINVDTKRKI